LPDLLTIHGLSVRFGRRSAVENLSLTIEDRGRVIGLFGQNGAGKSTLVRAVCGLINRYRGVISHCGSSIAYLPDAPFL